MYTTEDFRNMAIGTTVRTHNGNRWTKVRNDLWRVDSDPGWGPHFSSDLPGYAEVI